MQSVENGISIWRKGAEGKETKQIKTHQSSNTSTAIVSAGNMAMAVAEAVDPLMGAEMLLQSQWQIQHSSYSRPASWEY